jgi:3-phosphoshikimate 1-carboxyvinyltransferase
LTRLWPAAIAVTPCAAPLEAQVRVPGSKSLTNRALLLAALAHGLTRLTHALASDDSRHFITALRQLGFNINSSADETTLEVAGCGGELPTARAELFVGNAGTAARFLTALLTLGLGEYVLDGEPRMRQRPIGDLVLALRQLGAQVEPAYGLPPADVRRLAPPLRVHAAGLPGGMCRVAGDISSQFLSGLLMVAPYARAPVTIEVDGVLFSKPYVDMTLRLMADFGVGVERDGYRTFRVTPGCYLAQPEYPIEPDVSAASYFFAAPAIVGGRVRVIGLSRTSAQGDVGFVDVLARMGCQVSDGRDWLEVARRPGDRLSGVDIDMSDIPDTAMTLAAVAPFAESPTRIRGIESARVKESDRVAAMVTELRRLGVQADEHPDGLTIYPAVDPHGAAIRTYRDHRIAMAFSLVGLRVPGVVIRDPQCVSKTFPDYFEVLNQACGRAA